MPDHTPEGELGDPGLLLLRRSVDLERFQHAGGEHGAQAQRHVRALPDFLHRRRDDVRQPLPAVLGRAGESVPAGLDELAVGLLEALRRGDPAVGEPRALLVALAVQRIENFLREFRRLPEHRVDQLRVHLAVPGQRRDLRQARQLADNEAHVLERRGVLRHGDSRNGKVAPFRRRVNAVTLARGAHAGEKCAGKRPLPPRWIARPKGASCAERPPARRTRARDRLWRDGSSAWRRR